jgi:hypothetical protein
MRWNELIMKKIGIKYYVCMGLDPFLSKPVFTLVCEPHPTHYALYRVLKKERCGFKS